MKKLSIKLPKIRIRKRTLLIAGATILIVLSASVAAWVLASQQATARYTQHLDQATQQTKGVMSDAVKQFEQFKKEPDATKAVNAFDSLVTVLQQQQQALPSATNILGLQLESSVQIAKAQTINQAISELTAQCQKTKEFIAYQHALASVLASVIQKRGANADEQQALAAAWQELAKNLQSLNSPTTAKETHEKFIKNAESVASSLGTLPELYNKKDIAGFATKQKEIDSKINSLRSLYGDYNILAAQQDAALATTIHNLNKALEVDK